MNTDRLKVLVNIYLERKDDLLSSKEDVRRKWDAVAVCAENWNTAAEDFGAMFAKSMAAASPVLDERDSHPIEGIQALCDAGKTEEVRSAFEDLISADGGDLIARQQRIFRFVKTVNGLLEETAPDRWDYRQRIRTAIRYLFVIRPADNYTFHASEAAAFQGYCDVEEEIGYDRSLNLTNYYHMCDDAADYIGTRKDLLDEVEKAIAAKNAEDGTHFDPDVLDPNHHILVCDLISAAYRLDFYTDKQATRKSKISSVQQKKIERTKQRAELLDKREEVVDQLDAMKVIEKKAQVPDISGKTVTHSVFGEGTVDSQDGRYFMVTFTDGTKKKFALPGAIVGGYLTFDGSQEYVDALNQMETAAENSRNVSKELNSIDVQLQMLE